MNYLLRLGILFVGMTFVGSVAYAQQFLPRVKANQETRVEFRNNLLEERADFHEERNDLFEKARDVRAEVMHERGNLLEKRAEVRFEARTDLVELRAETKAALDAAETKEEKRAILEASREDRAEIREESKAFREELRNEVRDLRLQRADVVVFRYEAVITRLESIFDRLESRIASLDERGVDVTAASDLMIDLETDINDARLNFRAAQDVYAEIDSESMTEDEIKAIVAEAKELLAEVKENVKDAWETGRAIVSALKVSVNAEVETE